MRGGEKYTKRKRKGLFFPFFLIFFLNKMDNKEAQSVLSWHEWVKSETSHTEASVLSKKPTKEQLNMILSFSNPTCFCNMPVNRIDSEDHGTILECGRLRVLWEEGTSKSKYVCGFHLHETSWNMMKKKLEQTKMMEQDPEIMTCCLYNLTYCILLKTLNSSAKTPSLLPSCYCNVPVRLKVMGPSENPGEFLFICQKGRCPWLLPVKDTGFTRQGVRPHRMKDVINLRVQESPSLENHKESLLSAFSQPTETQRNYLESLNMIYGDSQGSSSKRTEAISNTTVNDATNPLVENECEESNTPDEKSQTLYETEDYVAQNHQWIDLYRKEKDRARQFEHLYRQEKERADHLDYLYKREQDASRIHIMSSAEDIACLEIKVSELTAERDELNRRLRDGVIISYKVARCICCHKGKAKYALLPCFHLAYCEHCSSELERCIVCEKISTKSQKINLV
ncbi:unnamed protein product [Rhizopus stolonifer]